MAFESLRAAIINEVEESFNHTQDEHKLSLRMEALSSWAAGAGDDFHVTPEALEQCKLYGLDSRYSFAKSKSPDDSMLEDYLDHFMSHFEEPPAPDGGDAEPLPIRERVLTMKVNQKCFDPLLLHLKETRPAFCRIIQQHSLLTGKSAGGRRKLFRGKKREKRGGSADSESKDGSRTREERDMPPPVPMTWENSSTSGKNMSKERIDVSADTMSWEHYRYVLALVVAKAVSSGSMQSILIAVSLLFQVISDDAEKKETRSIPVGDILCSIFEKKTTAKKVSVTTVTVPNPFLRCTTPGMKSGDMRKGQAMSDSVSRMGDVYSMGTVDEVGVKHPILSLGGSDDIKFLGGVHSDAGSTVGSTVGSLMAEQGTETASVGGKEVLLEQLDIISEDATEEELLAQALALSLSGQFNMAGGSAPQAVSFNVREASERSGDSPTLSESTVRESLKHSGGIINFDKLSEVYPMSTFGPFCSEEFWSHCVADDSSPLASLNPKDPTDSTNPVNVPIENVIIALVAYIRGGFDVMFGEESAPWMVNDPNSEEKGCKSDLLVASSLDVVPMYASHFALLENLIDVTLQSLVEIRDNAPANDVIPSVIRNNQERVELEIATSKWNFEKYFLVWTCNSLLQILKGNLNMLVISGTSPSSVGLDLRRTNPFCGISGLSPGSTTVSGSNNASSVLHQPLLCHLLKLTVECLGGNHLPNGCIGGRVDSSLGDSSATIPSHFPIPDEDEHSTGNIASHDQLWIACDAEYRHCLTTSAMDVFSQGFSTFFSSCFDRETLFYSIMHNSPLPGNVHLGAFFSDKSFFTLKRYCSSILSDQLSELLPLYYRSLLLQKLSINIASRRLKPFFFYGAGTGNEFANSSDIQSKAISMFEDFSGDHPRAKFIGFSPLTGDQTIESNDMRGSPNEEQKQISDNDAALHLYLRLLSRLGHHGLMKGHQSISSAMEKVDELRCIGPSSSMFWGELGLLETVQMCFVEHMCNPPPMLKLPCAFSFDRARCSENIVISPDGHTVTQQKNKAWSTVIAAGGFSPNTGIHKWSVHVEKCLKGNVFIGVVGDDASVDNYVGYDRHGWGFIGTPSLWHDHSKVRGDYGVKIAAGSVVHVSLDTNNKTLSFVISGTDWGVAFEHLPDHILYPAVSMYQLGDIVSVTSMSGRNENFLPSLSGNGANRNGDNNLEDSRAIMKYCFAFFAELDSILSFALNSEATREEHRISLAHPFIVTLFPQLAAALALGKFVSPEWSSYISLQVLPCLTRLTKMLAAAHEHCPSNFLNLHNSNVAPDCIVGDMCGDWKLESCADLTLPAQSYNVSLVTNGCDSMFKNKASDAKFVHMHMDKTEPLPASQRLRPVHFSGSGSSGVFSLKVAGTAIGTRLSLNEMWIGNDTCDLDCRLSLDGCSFTGRFSTANHSGSIVGTRLFNNVQSFKSYAAVNTLLKAALVGVMACGSLSCKLIVGIDSSVESREKVFSKKMLWGNTTSTASSSKAVHYINSHPENNGNELSLERGEADPGDDESENGEDENKFDDENAAILSNTRDVLLPEFESASEVKVEAALEASSKGLRWVSSNLLSAGLHMDALLLETLKDEVFQYVDGYAEVERSHDRKRIRLESSRHVHSFNHSKQVQDAWIAKVFPFIISDDLKLSSLSTISSMDPEVISEASENIPDFCQCLIDAKSTASIADSGASAAFQLDHYIVHHTGMAMLSRIGGDILQNARRTVLAVLIKHCGCISYCERVAADFRLGKILIEERPCTLLIQIWTAGQRIIEHALRKKQESGASFAFLGQELCAKAMILFEIQPQVNSIEISELLVLSNFDVASQNVLVAVQDMFSKILFDSVELLQTPVSELLQLKNVLIRSTLRGLSRTAGFRSISMLVGKTDDRNRGTVISIPSISNMVLLSAAMQFVIIGIHNCDSASALHNVVNNAASRNSSPRVVGLTSPIHSSPLEAVGPKTTKPAVSERINLGYYGEGLKGCSLEVFQSLRSSVESLYDFIAQFLQRCTWGDDINGQCSALACWNIHVQPEDHQFLNRCGIFKVLQSVLNSARKVESSPNDPDSSLYADLSDEGKLICENFARNNKITGVKILSRLAMMTVHSLASQVAFSKEMGSSVHSLGRPLQRQPSGPETLSQALFDMLFSELFCGFRQLVIKTKGSALLMLRSFDWFGTREIQKLFSKLSAEEDKPRNQVSSMIDFKFSLHGEEYIYRILRLLFSVSGSSVCRKYLSSPKWITLLLSGIGYGGNGVQRRLLRLLRKLLSPTNTLNVECYVPSLFSWGENDLFDTSEPFDDEDSKSLLADDCSGSITDNENFTRSHCARKISGLFLDAVVAIIPHITPDIQPSSESATHSIDDMSVDEDDSICVGKVKSVDCGTTDFLGLLNMLGTSSLISAESIYLLRSLLHSDVWRGHVLNELENPLSHWNELHKLNLEKTATVDDSFTSTEYLSMDLLRRISAVSGVVGGFPDRIREGGVVALKPMSLIPNSSVDSIAMRLASVSHDCGLVVENGNSGNVDVILVGTAGNQNVRYSSCNAPRPSTDECVPPPQGFAFSSSNPAKTFRVSSNDVTPISEILPVHTSLSYAFIEQFTNFIRLKSVPDVLTKINGTAPQQTPQKTVISEMMDSFSSTTSLRAISKCSENPNVVDMILKSSPELFIELLSLSMTESLSGGLSVCEKIEGRWCLLWDLLIAQQMNNFFPPRKADAVEMNNNISEGVGMDIRMQKLGSNEEHAGRGVADISEDESPFSSTGFSLLSAIRQQQQQISASPSERPEGALGGLFGLGGRARAALPAPQTVSESAKTTMLEMGFPPEWCDVALRRSRNNVEVAINLCFEHGHEMERLVEEDAAMQLQRQQAVNNRVGTGSRGVPVSRGARAGYIPASLRGESDDAIVDPDAILQMADLGFPASWCARALSATSNDPDAALTWILSHAEELLSEFPGATGSIGGVRAGGDRQMLRRLRRDGMRPGFSTSGSGTVRHSEESKNADEKEDTIDEADAADSENSVLGKTPLCVLAGQGTISDNYTCSVSTDGSFPSIGCRGYAAVTGKWYFEATIITSGCVQVGWADCGFIGLAEKGQGVGDCVNSWCFDGWRVMLWHEASAEWGARWTAGNVLGCAVDMDERKMIFTLNGEAESIGMGSAFEAFISCGGLYPACSISQGQQIRFNFGSKGFKYSPPEGHRPFSDHIMEVNISRGGSEATALSNQAMSSQCVDAIEEQQGESECNWSRRYFPVDGSHGSSIGGNRSLQYPEPSFQKGVPINDPDETLKQFKAVSTDLCILYSRLTVLNMLQSLSQSNDNVGFHNLLSMSNLKDRKYSSMEALLKLIRLCSISSNRSNIYLQTLSLMTPSSASPQNLGSIFSIGGFPVIGALYDSLSSVLYRSRKDDDKVIFDTLLNQLQNEIMLSTQREQCAMWKSPNGLIPQLSKTGQLPDAVCSSLPSLNLAVGLTILMIQQLSKELSITSSPMHVTFSQELEQALTWVSTLCRHWSLGLQSPSIVVKLCCLRMLNALIQEFVAATSRYNILVQANFMLPICDLIPLQRLRRLAMGRIAIERSTSPVCSEFLQALVEFVHTVSSTQLSLSSRKSEMTGDFASLSESEADNTYIDCLPDSSTEKDDSSIDFHWDAINGTLISDESWDTWTGQIKQLSSTDHMRNVSPTGFGGDSIRERPQKQPPELLVGCKVARMKKNTAPVLEEEAGGCEKTVRAGVPGAREVSYATSGLLSRDISRSSSRDFMSGDIFDSPPSDDSDHTGPPTSGIGTTNTYPNFRQRIADSESRQRTNPSSCRSGDNSSGLFSGRGPGGERRSRSRRDESNSFNMRDSPEARKEVSGWEIGTVVAIINHPDAGSMPGSARVIRWDKRCEKEVDNLPPSSKDSATFDESKQTSMGEKFNVAVDNDLQETVSWGHNGVYDVTHVSLNRDGTIDQKHPVPRSNLSRAIENGFGTEQTFGVILRIRKAKMLPSDSDEGIFERFDGVLEFCDFNASVYVTGTKWSDGAFTLTEEKLLSGMRHTTWSVRFGHAHWRPGTTYDLATSKYANKFSDKYTEVLVGQYNYPIHLSACRKKPSFMITGDISLQKSCLFQFDDKLRSSSINLSLDKLSAFSDGKESRSSVFGTVGFTRGVHYWEFKIEQGDIGNVFVGVSEKTWTPGQPLNIRLNKWIGSGFVNIRTSFRHTSTGVSDRVYGDHFHTGDTVGVLLDMDRGRLSFFLDGLKYGEHTLTDLGEAFDGLASSSSYRKALFPIVGMRRNLDRVTITSRWLSNYGSDAKGILDTLDKASGLLASWHLERTTMQPLDRDMWIYREAWREHHRWLNNPIDRVRTRCKAPLVYVGVDMSPKACAEASIRLGLPMALFRGDRITFTRSGGRRLETGEEAVILGAYKGILWYRLDSQHGTDANPRNDDDSNPPVLEGSALAWQLCVQDVDGLLLTRRAGNVDEKISALKLPRIPPFQGARLHIQFSNGAIMRDGIEIDTSEVVGTVAQGETVTAFERRPNSSNILRYRVAYNGKVGWISDRIRGGSEERMVSEVTHETACAVEVAKTEAIDVLKAWRLLSSGPKDPSETPWVDVATLNDAVVSWENCVFETVGTAVASNFLRKNLPENLTFPQFVEMAATVGSKTHWLVEADMQLSELISRVASKEGVSPLNVTAQRIRDVCRLLDPTNTATSHLVNVDVDRIVARASLLRVANIIFGYSLPYISLCCPEEKLQADLFGRLDEMEVCVTPIPNIPGKNSSVVEENRSMNLWKPPCDARKLRSLRRLLFGQTKSNFFESVLDSTTTPTPLPQDEYEEPREIKTIRVNRVKATTLKLSVIKSNSERLKVSVFGQIYKEMRGWQTSSYRRSYVGKGHGGQKRAFKVKFDGEGVNDYGGPYRAVFEQVIDEIQCDASPVAGQKAWEKTLLTLLMPCPNRASGSGINQDKFMFIPSNPSPHQHELMQFLGRLTGMAVRHNLNLGLDFCSLVWRSLVRLPVSRGHLNTVDSLFVSRLERMEKVGMFLERRLLGESIKYAPTSTGVEDKKTVNLERYDFDDFDFVIPAAYDSLYAPPEWEELTFTVYLSDGYTCIPLVPGGHNIPVNLGNWRSYVNLVEEFRIREGVVMQRMFRDGISAVLPVELLPLFTGPELELMISGTRTVDLDLLRKCTEYDNLEPDSELVNNFWSVLEEMEDDEKTLFLRFVWARSRMPATAQDFPMNFKLQAASTGTDFLPHAQTCFFSLALPSYASKDILREKLIYAINNSPNMDADVRLHNAEGWTD